MLLPRSTAHLGTRRQIQAAVRNFLVVQNGPSPTTDYYLAPRLPAAVTRYAELSDAGRGVTARDGELVVFCRYVNAGWLDWLEHHRQALAGVVLFLDDDFDMVLRSSSVPLSYRWRIWKRHHRHLRRMARLVDELWVSTEVLSDRYGRRCLLLPPVPPELPARPPGHPVEPTIAYHATRSHRAELAWLAPILARVLDRVPEARCHIIGFPEKDRAPADLPRTRLTGQMPWPDYRRFANDLSADVALAPLLPKPLNDARSEVKAFEMARLGAAGIYSDAAPYRSLVRHDVNGLSLPLDPGAWEQAIMDLLRDPARSRALAGTMARELEERRATLIADRSLLRRLLAAPRTEAA